MKKFLSIALVVAMLLSFALVASAEGTTYTITIDNSTSGYAYAAYQIFSGDVATLDGKTVLTNIQWGSGVNDSATDFQTKVLTALGASLGDEETFDAEYVASKLTEDNAAAFAKAVASYLSTDPTATFAYNETEKNYTASVAGGYYLIQNTEDGVPDDGAYTAYILKVTDNVTAKPKTGVPTIEKKVYDVNDTAGEPQPDTGTYKGLTGEGWMDSADHDIGDTIWYKVTFTIPADTLNHYKTYQLTITDILSKGLTYNKDSSKFYILEYDKDTDIGTTTLFDSFVVSESSNGSGTTLTTTVEDLIREIDVSGSEVDFSKEIVFCWVYSCTLNPDAAIGSAGNPNTVDLEYSNNPNGKGTGKTPEDKAIVFTYQVDVDKVDEENNPLEGAAFTLYKKLPSADSADENWKEVHKYNVDEDNPATTFSFKGLDDGTYKLVETTVPAGYNKAEDVIFTIFATHSEVSPEPKLLTLNCSNESFKVGKLDDGSFSGKLTTAIENKTGNTLPSTGGMGTTIFYIFGTILVLGAGILLIAKKRVAR